MKQSRRQSAKQPTECKICGEKSIDGTEIKHRIMLHGSITTDYKVHFDKDYTLFSFFDLNRDIDEKKVQTYYDVLIHGGNLPPIMVAPMKDGVYKVGDGQHRKEAWQKAGKEIAYMIWENMSIDIIPILNYIKPWNNKDYNKSHSDKPDYIFYNEMFEKYNRGAYKMTHDVLLTIMGGLDSRKITPLQYKHGDLKLSNEVEAKAYIEIIHRYQEALLSFEKDGLKLYDKYINDRMLKGVLNFMKFPFEENMKYIDTFICCRTFVFCS